MKSGRIYFSRILNFLRTLPKFGRRRVPNSVRVDIEWWINFAPQYNESSLIPECNWLEPSHVLSTDSYLEAGGGYCQGSCFHFQFPQNLKKLKLDINQLEYLVLTIALTLWGHKLRGRKIRLLCDNQATVAAVNSGSSRNEKIEECLRKIHTLQGIFSFKIKVVYINTLKNRVSDALSRWYKSKRHQENFFALTHGDVLEEFEVKQEHWSFIL